MAELNWFCAACGHDWVAPNEHIPPCPKCGSGGERKDGKMPRGPTYDLSADPNRPTTNRWLVHFKYTGPFTLECPHWVLHYNDDGFPTIRCAIIAPTIGTARRIILEAHEREPNQSTNAIWGASQRKADGWSPFDDKYSREEWMRWP